MKTFIFDVDGTLSMGFNGHYEGQRTAEIPMQLLRQMKSNGHHIFLANSHYWCRGLGGFVPLIPNPPSNIGWDTEHEFPMRKWIIEQIIKEYKLDKKSVYYIADLPRDKACAEACGVNFVWADEFKYLQSENTK
jgi:hypothetical protein